MEGELIKISARNAQIMTRILVLVSNVSRKILSFIISFVFFLMSVMSLSELN
jgi:hypothetical protein